MSWDKIRLFVITVLVFVYLGLVGFGQSFKQMRNSCQIDNFKKINVKLLDKILLGNWKYNYSFVNDTCFYIANLGDLPVGISFEKTDVEDIKSNYPKLYSFGNDKLLFGLISYHEKNPFGESTYPLVNVISKDSSTVKITHYVKSNGVGKGYEYFLDSIDEDKLVLQNERSYTLDGKKIFGVRHVYVKQLE